MFEYIKGLSVTLAMLSEKVKDTKYSNELKDLSLSFLRTEKFFVKKEKDINNLEDLRIEAIYLISLLEVLRSIKKISVSNADFIIRSVNEFVTVLGREIDREKSMTASLLSLSELDTKLVRSYAKNYAENLYTVAPKVSESSQVNFHKIFEKEEEKVLEKHLEEKSIALVSQNFEVELPKQENSPESFNPIESVKIGSGENVVESKIVYTYLPDGEQKIIEDRRSKILGVLKLGGGSIKEVSRHFKGLNEKTLQRDLLELMREKRVVMMGKKRWAKYYLK